MRRLFFPILVPILVVIGSGMAAWAASGEQPLTSAIYKSSHNSYDRDESLAQQIDSYNVWQIELDINDFEGSLKVSHACDPASLSAASTLDFLLQKMVRESVTFGSRFTIIYLDMKEGCGDTWGADIGQRLTNAFQNDLGSASIYPSSKFIANDNQQWPSRQELSRRKYNWGIIVDWHGPAPANANPQNIFFTVAQSDPLDPSKETPDAVLFNVDGGCDVSPTSEKPSIIDSRWLSRCYPGGCGQTCVLADGAYWQNGLAKGYNLIATNCVDHDNTFQPPTQSPDPLYLALAASKSCPESYSSCEWGTITFPFQDLTKAIARSSPLTTILVAAGTYRVPAPGGMTIRTPVTLQVTGTGAVIFQ